MIVRKTSFWYSSLLYQIMSVKCIHLRTDIFPTDFFFYMHPGTIEKVHGNYFISSHQKKCSNQGSNLNSIRFEGYKCFKAIHRREKQIHVKMWLTVTQVLTSLFDLTLANLISFPYKFSSEPAILRRLSFKNKIDYIRR